MEYVALLKVLVLVVCPFLWVLLSTLRRRRKFPPGPYPYPIIGNILQLGQNPHRSLASLSKTYGSLMSLQLGSTTAVVVSSPELAKQVLQKNDHLLSGRSIPAAMEAYKNAVGFLPVGTHWRKLRKICKEHMFSAQGLDSSQVFRRQKRRELCAYVEKCCTIGRAMDIGEAAFITSLNLITSTLFSSEITGFDSEDSQGFYETIKNLTRVVGIPNLADFFPVLKVIDPQGIRRETEVYIGKVLAVIEDIIKQRLDLPAGSPRKHDLLEVLLDIRETSGYEMSLEEIKQLFLDLIIAGTDNTSTTIEWAMTELLLNPKKMAFARSELKRVIKEDEQVEESDISKLPYLQAVIKETFRCHPPAPFLIPHKAEEDVEINGFAIPKNTQIIVNVWAISRDSSIWAEPSCFEPERFLNSKVDFKGHDFTLIPFGSGRRICPALPLADRMLHPTVASLIRDFDWKLEAGNKLDRADKFGLALQKAVPLKAIPIKV